MTGFSLENITIKSLTVKNLKKTSAVFGCVLFLCSIILPFYHLTPPSMIESYSSTNYWSFKSRTQFLRWGLLPDFRDQYTVLEYWFHDYWFSDTFIEGFGLSWLLVYMFVIQIIVLATGIMSIFNSRRIFTLVPAIISPVVIASMVYMGMHLSQLNLAADPYQLGYWLTYPATGLFFISFLVQIRFN